MARLDAGRRARGSRDFGRRMRPMRRLRPPRSPRAARWPRRRRRSRTAADAPRPDLPGVLLAWRFDPLALVLLVVAAARLPVGRQAREPGAPGEPAPGVSVLAVRRRPGRHRRGPALADRGVRGLALQRPHGPAHAPQLVAAPLLLAGAPITLALRAASPSRAARGCWRSSSSRIVHVLSFPVIAWMLFAAVNWGWHFSVLYDQALENPRAPLLPARDLPGGRAPLLVAGHRRRPVAVALPHPVRLLYLFLAMPQNSFLGVALLPAPTSSTRTT